MGVRAPIVTARPSDSHRYNAFISYSRKVDTDVAAAFQSALQRFAKPWYRMRAVRVFRDDTDLRNEPLRPAVKAALDQSEFLVLLASPAAAQSEWIAEEVGYWREYKKRGHLLIVLTEGDDIVWDDRKADFDWTNDPPLPRTVSGAFDEEPRWSDLRQPKRQRQLSLSNPEFRSAVADVAASLHHVEDKSQIVGEEVRQHRRTKQVAGGAMLALAGLAVAATVLALLAYDTSQLSRSRELAATANAQLSADPERSVFLASQAYDVRKTPQALDALERALVDLHVRATVPGRRPHLAPGSNLVVVKRGAARVWNWRARRILATFHAPRGRVTDARLDGSGKLLVTGSDVGPAVVWQVRGVLRLGEFDAGTGGARSVAFDPSATHVATGGGSEVRVWHQRNRRVVAAFRAPAGTRNVSFGDEGRLLLAAGPRSVTVWNWRRRQSLLAVSVSSDPSDHPELSPDGRALLLEDGDDALVYRLSGAPPSEFHATLQVTDAVFTRDGRQIVLADLAGGAEIWDLKRHRLVARLTGQSTARAVASGPRGIVAVGSEDGAITLWAPPATEPLAELRGHRSAVTQIVVGRDRTVATASGDGTVRVWHVPGLPVARVRSPRGRRPSVAATGTRAVVADGKVRVRVPGRNRPVFVTEAPFPATPALSRDGRLLAIGGADSIIRVWDVERRALVARLRESSRTLGLAFDPSGRFLAFVPFAREIALPHVWDVETERVVATLVPVATDFWQPSFAADGRSVVLSSDGGSYVYRCWLCVAPSRLRDVAAAAVRP